MTNLTIRVGGEPVILRVGENTAEAVRQRQLAEAAVVAAGIEADRSEAAREAALTAAKAKDYRATLAEGIADFPVDPADGYFYSDDQAAVTDRPNELRMYKRIAAPPYYQDLGDQVAPATMRALGYYLMRPLVGETDMTPRFDALIATYKKILLVGTFTAATLPAKLIGQHVQGAPGEHEIIIDPAMPDGDLFEVGNLSSVRGVKITGPATWDDEDDANGVTADDFLDQVVAGSVNAIRLRGVGAVIEENDISGMPGWAIVTSPNNTIGTGLAVNSTIRGNRGYNNYGGLQIPETSEYLRAEANTFGHNIIGLDLDGGNNIVIVNHFDHNRCNLIGRGGQNNGHGSIVANSFNHGKKAAAILVDITVGDILSSNNFHDGGDIGIYARNCLGLDISNNILGRMNMYLEGKSTVDPEKPGVNRLMDIGFFEHGATYNIHRNWVPTDPAVSSTDGTSDPAFPDNWMLRRNYHIGGRVGVDGSSWNNLNLNDPDVPDDEGWISGQMDPADSTTRYCEGKPVRARAQISGTGTIRLQPTLAIGMGNGVVTMRVTMTAPNGRSAVMEFDAFAGVAAWANAIMKVRGGWPYNVRLGRTSDPTPLPVIFVGELTDTHTALFVEVEYFRNVRGTLPSPIYWKYGWSITRVTAFEDVSATMLAPAAAVAPIIGTLTYNPASIAVGAAVTTTVTVTGAALGATVGVSINVASQGVQVRASLDAANTATVTYYNPPHAAGAVDLPNHTVKVTATS